MVVVVNEQLVVRPLLRGGVNIFRRGYNRAAAHWWDARARGQAARLARTCRQHRAPALAPLYSTTLASPQS